MLAKYGKLISANYRTLVRDKYGAEIYDRADIDLINAWVKQKTEGKIDRILDKLPPDAAAVLLNAVYFKAAWVSAFVKSATREDDFNLSSAKKVRVSMMRQEAAFAMADRPDYSAIRLNYSQQALGMVIVLPKEVEGLETVARQLDARELSTLFAALKSDPAKRVSLALPSFKAAFEADLAEPFQKAGMTLAFSDLADFSGMTGSSPSEGGVKIGQIKHRAVIEVSEPGTEAAAATAVVMLPKRSQRKEQPTPVPFVVDRPFLFYVVDDSSGAILFQGRIVDPRQQ